MVNEIKGKTTNTLFKKYNPIKFNKVHIFKLRIVNKIKGKATNAPFKKSRFII